MAMKRTGTVKGSKSEEKEEDACPEWVNGIKSVLDVTLQEPAFDPPVEPPAAKYLEEVTLGMTGGAGDPSAQAASVTRRPGTRPTAVNRMQALLPVVTSDAACSACRAVFWLALGGIFGHVPEKALSGYRDELGKSWYALTLQTMAGTQNDRELQDAVFFAFPYVFAQAVYRLFVDGFVEDRKHFVMEADKLLLKASMVAHFEVTGFQVTSETVRRARQRLFLRRVVQSPHADQRELMKGRKRQEILESHSAGAGEQPLEFGKLSLHPLEETQLDHVMHESEHHRRKTQRHLDAGKPVWDLETTPVPAELSVDRYAPLTTTGMEMLDRHMNELKVCMGEEEEEVDAEEEQHSEASPFSSPPGSEPPSPGMSPPGSPLARSRGATWSNAGSLLSPTSPGMEPESPPGSAGLEGGADGSGSPGDPASPSRNRQRFRKVLTIARLNLAKEDSHTRKKRADQAKKMRQELLARKIGSEDLPKELSGTNLNTVWVSPPMMSNACSQDRLMLHKTSTDSFQLRMAAKSLQQRPLSTPVLRSAGKPRPRRHHGLDASLGGGGSGGASSSQGGGTTAGGDSNTVGGRVGSAVNVRAEGLNPSASAPSMLPRVSSQAGKTSNSKGEANPSSASAPLPRVGAALSGGRSLAAVKGEVISLDPPTRLSGKVVLQRLEGHMKMFQKQSFAIYMKEHDILTGFKKNTSDPKRLRDEEETYVKKMATLVGGDPRRLIAPEGVRDRHLRESSAEDHLSGAAAAAAAATAAAK